MRTIASKFALVTSVAVLALVLASCSAQGGSGTGGPTASASPCADTGITKIEDVCQSATPAEIEAIAHYGIVSLNEDTNPAYGRPNRSCVYLGSGHSFEVDVYEGEIVCSDGQLTLPSVPGFGDQACGKGILFQVQVGKWVARVNTSEPPETRDNQVLLQSVAKLVLPRLKLPG